MLTNIKAVIFDLDGTLLNSMWVWKHIDIEFLDKHNYPFDEQLQSRIEGMSFTETAHFFQETYNIPMTIEEIKQSWIDMTMDKYLHEVNVKEGAISFLQMLKEKGIKTGIATSNSRELAMAAIKNFGLEQYIDYLATGCEVEKGKPSPDIYLHVAKILNASPKECLVFEDVPAGIQAGISAGMKVCAIDDDFSKAQEQKKREMADYFIYNYLEITE